MSRKHWFVILVVLGAGILLQIPGNEPGGEDHGDHAPVSAPDTTLSDRPAGPGPGALTGPYRTIALEVTGMT